MASGKMRCAVILAAALLAAPAGAPRAQGGTSGAAAPARKEWTVMLYMCAKDKENSLEEAGFDNINDMERAGSSDRVNIVVEFSRLKSGAKRYYVTRDEDRYKISSPVLEHIQDVNIGDWRHLADFVIWARRNYPARRYMLVVWGHSNGWFKGKPVTQEYNFDKGIAYDDATGNNIDTPQLRKTLEIAGGVDVFATDACLMQMAEVAYELKDNAGYIVSSEGTTSSRGHPYSRIFSRLAGSPEMPARELASFMVDAYRDRYGCGSSLSAVDAKALPRLRELADALAVRLMSAGDREKVRAASSGTRDFNGKGRKDFYDFARQAAGEFPGHPEVKAAADELMAFLRGSLVINSTGDVRPGSDANGVSVYIPAQKNGWLDFLLAKPGCDKNYDELLWAVDGKWDELLRWALE